MKKIAAGFPVDSMTLMLTLRCNLSCSYCLRHADEEEMPEALARRAVDLLFARGSGPKALTFSGGEPLLRLPRVRALSRLARRRADAAGISLQLNVLTNATLLDQAALDFFAAEDVRVVVTLNGEPEAHDRFRRSKDGRGSWLRLEKGLGTLVERLPPAHLLATLAVHPKMAHRLHDDFVFLRKRGLRHFNLCAVFGVPWSARQVTDLVSQYGAVLADAVASAQSSAPVVIQGLRSGFRRLSGTAPAYDYSDQGGTHCPMSFRLTAWPDGVLSVNPFRFGPQAADFAVGHLRDGFKKEYLGCAPDAPTCKGDDCRKGFVDLDRAYGAAYMAATGSDPEGFRRSWQANVLLCEGALNEAVARKVWKRAASDSALKRYVEVSTSWCDLVG